MIIEDFYSNREERVYEDVCPTLRSERNGLKVMTNNQTCISTKGKQIEVASTILAGYERTNMTGFNADNGVVEKVLGVTLFESDNFGGWKVNKEEVAPTLRAEKVCAGAISQYRIRKLTPRECWRLMDFTDEDFEKAAEVNSNTQLYKQAGNSIIRNVLVAILGQLIEGKEDAYRKL
jgi:site-specific DNA-cytosine methylase